MATVPVIKNPKQHYHSTRDGESVYHIGKQEPCPDGKGIETAYLATGRAGLKPCSKCISTKP